MKPLLCVLSVVLAFGGPGAQTHVWQPSAGNTQVAIWPGTPSDAQKDLFRTLLFQHPQAFAQPYAVCSPSIAHTLGDFESSYENLPARLSSHVKM